MKMLTDQHMHDVTYLMFRSYPYGEWRYEMINDALPNDPYYDKYADAVLGIPSLLEWYLESSCNPECGTPFTDEVGKCNKKLPLWGELFNVCAYSDPVLCNIHRNYKSCDTTERLHDGSVYETADDYLTTIIPIIGRLYANSDTFWREVEKDPANGYGPDHWPTLFDIDRHFKEQIRKLDDPETILIDNVCNPECTISYEDSDYLATFQCSVQVPGGYNVPMQYDEYACKVVKSLKKCIKKEPTEVPEEPENTDNDKKDPIRTVEPDNKTGVIVGGVVGGIAGVAAIGACIWFGYRWYKSHSQNIDNVEA